MVSPTTWASLVAQTVKSLSAMQETRVWSLGQEDTLEKWMATHSSVLVWEIPWTEEPGGLQFMGSQKSWTEWLSLSHNLKVGRAFLSWNGINWRSKMRTHFANGCTKQIKINHRCSQMQFRAIVAWCWSAECRSWGRSLVVSFLLLCLTSTLSPWHLQNKLWTLLSLSTFLHKS